MGKLSELRTHANRWLAPWNVQIGTLTAERAECDRLSRLDQTGHFNRPVFPTPTSFEVCNYTPILESVAALKKDTAHFNHSAGNGAYSFRNAYFDSPDAEVAYALTLLLQPGRIVEIGSGNSTRLFRQAINAGAVKTNLISIDPFPRVDINGISDRVMQERFEALPPAFLPELLESGDFLFIDSSHEIRAGNDVLTLLLNILPALKSGVVIHLHDIFLPYDYPRQWLIENRWESFKEQYLVQAILQDSNAYEVLWPGHYLQRTLPDFASRFSGNPIGVAKSLWLRKVASKRTPQVG